MPEVSCFELPLHPPPPPPSYAVLLCCRAALLQAGTSGCGCRPDAGGGGQDQHGSPGGAMAWQSALPPLLLLAVLPVGLQLGRRAGPAVDVAQVSGGQPALTRLRPHGHALLAHADQALRHRALAPPAHRQQRHADAALPQAALVRRAARSEPGASARGSAHQPGRRRTAAA